MTAIFATKPRALAVFFCALAVGAAAAAHASVVPPEKSEPRSTAKRVAARALQRSSSTEWPSDVAERLRRLEEHAERAARSRRAGSNEEATR